VFDIAPTVLHVFGLPISSNMAGRSLVGISKNSSKLSRKPVFVSPQFYELKARAKRVRMKLDM
jgi:arylsulfatase A-like enzyme